MYFYSQLLQLKTHKCVYFSTVYNPETGETITDHDGFPDDVVKIMLAASRKKVPKTPRRSKYFQSLLQHTAVIQFFCIQIPVRTENWECLQSKHNIVLVIANMNIKEITDNFYKILSLHSWSKVECACWKLSEIKNLVANSASRKPVLQISRTISAICAVWQRIVVFA